MRTVYKLLYKNKDGIAVSILKKAPKHCKEKADIIVVSIVKKGKKIISENRYFTPDEVQGLAIGLLNAVDEVMNEKFKQFREEKNHSDYRRH